MDDFLSVLCLAVLVVIFICACVAFLELSLGWGGLL